MIFFLLALVPIIVWALQWYFNKKVVWQEAAAGAGAALLAATIFFGIESTDSFVPSDTETWSGRVQYAQYQPSWKEYYEEAIYRTETYYTTDSKGRRHAHTRRVFSHWSPRSRWHNASWWAVTTLGTNGISQGRYADILKEFGGVTKVAGDRRTGEHDSRMLEGDPNDDRTVNSNSYVYPVTTRQTFDNRLLKATDSLYSFEPVPAEQAKALYDWPENENQFDSDRLLGSARSLWDRRAWDQMNSVLGPTKFVNLIAIGFPSGTAMELGTRQERHWKGGKKNDLVLTFGGNPQKPEWAYVFGWTEHETVKRLLENRLRDGTASIDEITRLVRDEYKICEFEEKFMHVEVETPWWYYLIFAIVVIGSQTFAHFAFTNNDTTKDSPSGYTSLRRMRVR
jgi:hypothetical protein